MDLTDIPGIGPAFRERLQGAGVTDVPALAAADDLESLAASTGIPLARLEGLRDAARDAAPPSGAEPAKTVAQPEDAAPPGGDASEAAPTPAAAVGDVARVMREAAEDMRVVLIDAAATAKVKIGSIWHEDVPLIAARWNENEQRVLERVRENAVVLRERAETAVVRINDEVHQGLPIFKERVREGAGSVREEFRVRVKEIKERSNGTPLWRRVLGRRDGE